MPNSQTSSKRCPHISGYTYTPRAENIPGFGKWVGICSICALAGDAKRTPSEALESFWRKDLEARFKEVGFKPEYVSQLFKEDTMYVPADPQDAYKFGVRQATEPIIVANLADQYVNDVLSDRRKKLLTKKVTKWVAVAISPSNGKPYAQGYFQDSKESALANKTGDPGDPTFIGVYPIEIEVPL